MLEDMERGDTKVYNGKCRIKDLLLTPKGECAVTFILPRSFLNSYDDYKEKDLNIKLSRFRNKRSLDSNAYFWELCGLLSAKLKISPRDIYRILVKEVGGNYEVTPIKTEAVDTWTQIWENRGLGWVCDVLGKSKIDGYTNVINYFGSSEYDTAQMSRLIELIVRECKNNGIETETPEIRSLWEGN